MGFMLEKKTAPVTDRYEGGGVGKHGRFKRIPGEAEAQHKEKMEKLFFFFRKLHFCQIFSHQMIFSYLDCRKSNESHVSHSRLVNIFRRFALQVWRLA